MKTNMQILGSRSGAHHPCTGIKELVPSGTVTKRNYFGCKLRVRNKFKRNTKLKHAG